MLQTSLLLMKNLNKTETTIFLFADVLEPEIHVPSVPERSIGKHGISL